MSTTSAQHWETRGQRCAAGSTRRVRHAPHPLPSGTMLRLARARVLHASPARQLQPSQTPLTFDPRLADAPHACAVDHCDHHHRLRGPGRQCDRLWLDHRRLRALIARLLCRVCTTVAGSAPGRARASCPPPGADPLGCPTTDRSLAERWRAARRSDGTAARRRGSRDEQRATEPTAV